MKKLGLFMALAVMAGTASAELITAPGVLSLGNNGDTNTVNNAVPDTYLYGRNSLIMSNNNGVLEIRTGSNNFDAISIGYGSDDLGQTLKNSFAVSSGEYVSFYFDFKAASGITGVPTFQIRLNDGDNADGERISVTAESTTTGVDLAAGSVRYYVTDFLIPDHQNAPAETVFATDVFVSFANSIFTRDTYVGDLTGASVSVVPEPATVGMLGLGALVALLIRRVR